jgi:hypothetical protein
MKPDFNISLWVGLHKSDNPDSEQTRTIFKKYNQLKPFIVDVSISEISGKIIAELNKKFSSADYIFIKDSEYVCRPSVKKCTINKMIQRRLETLKKEKNLYLLTVQEGVDAFEPTTFSGNRTQHSVIGFGNSTLTSYKASFQVGEIPRADIEMECGNIVFFTGQSSGLKNPAINRVSGGTADTGLFILSAPSTGTSIVDVLKAGDVTINFTNTQTVVGGSNWSGIHIQSADIDVPLSRTPIERLGDELPFAKPLDFPLNVTCSISALVTDFTTGALQHVLTGCAFGGGTDITISASNRCNNSLDTIKYIFKNAVLDSQNFSIGLEDNETVDLTFSAQIGGITTTSAGLFMTGSHSIPATNGGENVSFITGVVAAANQPI